MSVSAEDLGYDCNVSLLVFGGSWVKVADCDSIEEAEAIAKKLTEFIDKKKQELDG